MNRLRQKSVKTHRPNQQKPPLCTAFRTLARRKSDSMHSERRETTSHDPDTHRPQLGLRGVLLHNTIFSGPLVNEETPNKVGHRLLVHRKKGRGRQEEEGKRVLFNSASDLCYIFLKIVTIIPLLKCAPVSLQAV